MADYRDQFGAIRAAGASVAAVSVDPPETAAAVRRELALPFPILCDVERGVVREWGIFNARERGGIAVPAVFLLGPGRAVRYASVDKVALRVPARAIVGLLRDGLPSRGVSRGVVIPGLASIFRAIRNARRPGK